MQYRAAAAAGLLFVAMYGTAIADIVPAGSLRFQVKELAFPPNSNLSVGDLISANGYVVGFNGSSNVMGTRWDASGSFTNLADPIGSSPPVPDCRAYAVNSLGQAAGVFTTNAQDYRPVRWNSPNTATQLGLIGPYTGATPFGLNDAGQLVGVLKRSAFDVQPVKWSPDGTPSQLSLPVGQNAGEARAINEIGTIVGNAYNTLPPARRHAAKWLSNGAATLMQEPQSTTDSFAFDVNNSGQAVGWGDVNGRAVGLRWDAAGNVSTLLPPGSSTAVTQAWGIDEDGRAGGAVGNFAYLWDTDGTPYLLSSLLAPGSGSYTFNVGYGIDSDGSLVRVVTSATSGGGITGHYLLTAYIPEPGAVPALTLAFISLCRRRANSCRKY
jgi:uncharacterized membrane protein